MYSMTLLLKNLGRLHSPTSMHVSIYWHLLTCEPSTNLHALSVPVRLANWLSLNRHALAHVFICLGCHSSSFKVQQLSSTTVSFKRLPVTPRHSSSTHGTAFCLYGYFGTLETNWYVYQIVSSLRANICLFLFYIYFPAYCFAYTWYSIQCCQNLLL